MITRRRVLALAGVAAAGALGGCDMFGGRPKPTPKPHPLAPVLAETEALAAKYDAALAAYPTLGARLGPVRDDHHAHVAALASAMGRRTPSPTASAPATGTPAGTPAAAVAALRAAEAAARTSAYDACLTLPGSYTALVGSITAARTAHLEVVR